MFDIATTATLRPELLERTYRTFFKHGLGSLSWRIVLNVDPVGSDATQDDVIAIAERYGKSLLVNCPSEPSFPAAWKWCVSELAAKYVFWLEDDWAALRDFDVISMVETMERHPDLALLRLPRWESTSTCRQWNRRDEDWWNGEFFEVPRDSRNHCGYSGNPSLVRRDFIQPIVASGFLDCSNYDVEKQLSGFSPYLHHYVQGWRYGIWQAQNAPATVRDTGEQWRKERNIGKGDKIHFKTWEMPA